ncbi:uncharacterized protein BJ212DRAFT_1296453 [Suillus subaureus]|uniref:Uncharacterized protein n=1 Tax=Suillus subaureus TaxID=48587 RepID=A0A9P7JIJ3_9AGAM|nr:uncharacterized protein BJ212DRAFT_1296453 [Suillus subaureus]KAG1823936.1 hypothetical protein BJ212DRAFT_1296453 [Suillus subaureus]
MDNELAACSQRKLIVEKEYTSMQHMQIKWSSIFHESILFLMLSLSLKFDLNTLQLLSASASCSHTGTHSHEEIHDDNHDVNILEAVNTMSVQEPTESKAKIMLNLVRAKCDVYQAQKVLTDCVVQVNEVFASLLKFQEEAAEKRLDDTDLGLGCMRIVFNVHGWSVPPSCIPQEQGGGSHSCGMTSNVLHGWLPMIKLN